MAGGKNSLKKVVWAVDPFSEMDETWMRAEQVLSKVCEFSNCNVVPTYVLGADSLHWIGNVMPPNVDHFVPLAEKALGDMSEQSSLKNLAEPVVVVNHENSRRFDIKALLSFAKNEGADLIVLNTHAREGVARFFMGSFAESTLLKSDVPLLFVSPKTAPLGNIEKVLFPTDFSEASKSTLDKFVDQYAGVVKEIVLLNKIPHPVDAFVQTGVATVGGGWVSVEQFMTSEIEERTKAAEAMAKKMATDSLKVSVEIDDSPGQVVDVILETAKKHKCHMIAMSAESGLLSSIVIGSVARGVIREAEMPVWVSYHATED
ncbi:MAG: universal stress protein [Pseudobdellovibrionaceae bacterium]|nr:universal stress protein [Bdellovibrionales bacterium]USN47939.1 MAG: universal stress protein [Pseudobdellovibrionaceae bacterium]